MLLRFCAIYLLGSASWAVGLDTVAAAPALLQDTETIAALKSELQEEAGEDRFSGAVLVAKDGNPIFEQVYGYANREAKTPNTVDTKFRFGSMGKMFTAVAILQLVEAGKVKLDDPIAKYLPDYPNKEVAAVTVHQLLTHTGGTGDIFTPEYDQKRADIKDLKDYVALYGNRGPKFTPGSRWEYSNYGYVLLGRIIEVASGQSYYDYVRDHIFRRAGMDSTDNVPEDQPVQGLATGYTRGQGPHLIHMGPGPGAGGAPAAGAPRPTQGPEAGPRANADDQKPGGPLRSTEGTLPYRGTSAGGGYSTVRDLLKFADALRSHTLLNEHFTNLLITGKVETPRPGIKYGYGFEDQTTQEGIHSFGHGGGAPGMNGRLAVFPKSGYVVIVLSNFDPPAADNLARFIDDRLPGR